MRPFTCECMFVPGCTNWAKNDHYFHRRGSKYNKEAGFSQASVYISCEVFIALNRNEVLIDQLFE